MRGWMREMERQAVQLRGIPGLVQGAVTVITDGNEQDKVQTWKSTLPKV